MTVDFRRFYTLTLPDCISGLSGTVLYRLSQGLTRLDGSLLREELLAEAPAAKSSGGSPQLSWHGWDEKTMLLLSLNNLLSAFFGVPGIRQPGGESESGEPESKQSDGKGNGDGETAQQMVDRLKRMFSGQTA